MDAVREVHLEKLRLALIIDLGLALSVHEAVILRVREDLISGTNILIKLTFLRRTLLFVEGFANGFVGGMKCYKVRYSLYISRHYGLV